MQPSLSTIAIIANTSWSIYNFRCGLIRQLLLKGVNILIIAPRDEYSEKLEAMGCIFEAAPVKKYSLNLLHDLRYALSLYRLMKKWKVSYALTYTIKPNIYGQLAARWLGIPGLAIVTGLGRLFITPSWKTRAAMGLLHLGFRATQKVWFLNEEDRDFFLEAGVIQPIQAGLLPSEGVNTSFFHYAPLPDAQARFTFLFAGRLMKEKGLFDFVEAARRLKAKGVAARFLLAGFVEEGAPGAASMAELMSWQDEALIEYCGAYEDIRPLIRRCDAVVLPTFYREGVPRILLEAASMGRPIIATDNVGCREIVNDGYNGFLCRKNCPTDLAGKMEGLLLLPRSESWRMGRAGRKIVLERFAEQYVIQQYLSHLGLGLPIPVEEQADRLPPAYVLTIES